jgi:hypothetical protein
MDYKALADALAARFAPGVVTPPSGYPNIRASTAQAPNAIPATPYVIVWQESGDLTFEPGRLLGEHEMPVVLYLDKASGDVPRQLAALESWLGVLIGQFQTTNKLGITGVMKAIPMSYTFGVTKYENDLYEVIHLIVHIWTEEVFQITP